MANHWPLGGPARYDSARGALDLIIRIPCLLAALSLALAACGTTARPGPALPPGTTQIPFTLLSKGGPIGDAAQPLAAGTLTEITQRLRLAPSALCPPPSQHAPADACWSSLGLSTSDLLVALYPPDQCFSNELIVALRGSTLTLLEWTGEFNCPPGSGTRARPRYWLIGISKARLPSGDVTLTLSHQDVHPDAGQIGASGSITIKLN